MRAYGLTNAAPYATAPAVGLAGDTYWNTTESALYVSNGTAWGKPPASGDGSIGTQTRYTANTTLTTANQDSLIDCFFGNVQLTLPAFSTTLSGKVFRITRVDASTNQATIMPAGADTIDGVNAFITIAPNESVSLMVCGTVANARNWVRVADPTWKTIHTGNVITPVDPNKVVVSQAAGNAMTWGARAVKARLGAGLVADASSSAYLSLNCPAPFTAGTDNTGEPSWVIRLRGTSDDFTVQRAPATSGTTPAFTSLLTLDNTGALTIAGALYQGSGARLVATAGLYQASQNEVGMPGQDTSKPAWRYGVNGTSDYFFINRAPANTTTFVGSLLVDATGRLVVQGPTAPSDQAALVVGTRTMKGRLHALPGFEQIILSANRAFDGTNWAEDDATKAGWNSTFDLTNDRWTIQRAPASNGAGVNLILLDNGGNLTINGATATKASGTTWANPSDPRLKLAVGPYAKGLAAIGALEPITYYLRANPDVPCYGFDAAAVRPVFPECVTETRMRLDPADEEPTDGVLVFDMHPILVALVNATKECGARIAALEARHAG